MYLLLFCFGLGRSFHVLYERCVLARTLFTLGERVAFDPNKCNISSIEMNGIECGYIFLTIRWHYIRFDVIQCRFNPDSMRFDSDSMGFDSELSRDSFDNPI